mmetsp:Transcript_40033/g.52421  ORF Transcript_40033/g.52421 Transcript_40033/m.52421 type:complete len:86 (+) Transcript_40033:121-378(+)
MAKKILFGGESREEEVKSLPDSIPEITLPAIVSDVDGVVLRGKTPIEGSKEAVIKLLSEYKDTGRTVPFTFFTNGGGSLESYKAN